MWPLLWCVDATADATAADGNDDDDAVARHTCASCTAGKWRRRARGRCDAALTLDAGATRRCWRRTPTKSQRAPTKSSAYAARRCAATALRQLSGAGHSSQSARAPKVPDRRRTQRAATRAHRVQLAQSRDRILPVDGAPSSCALVVMTTASSRRTLSLRCCSSSSTKRRPSSRSVRSSTASCPNIIGAPPPPPPPSLTAHRRPSMVGSNVDQRVFAELVAERFPAIAKHLADIGLPIVIVSLPWFLCLFISCERRQSVRRPHRPPPPQLTCPWRRRCVFSTVSSLTGRKCSFRLPTARLLRSPLTMTRQCGLALLALHKNAILASHDPVQVRELLRHAIDTEQLLAIAFGEYGATSAPDERNVTRRAGSLSTERIRSMRARHRFQTINDLQLKNKKTQLRDLQRSTVARVGANDAALTRRRSTSRPTSSRRITRRTRPRCRRARSRSTSTNSSGSSSNSRPGGPCSCRCVRAHSPARANDVSAPAPDDSRRLDCQEHRSRRARCAARVFAGRA